MSDRFLLANVAYQGYGGGLDVDMLWEVGRIATGGLMPELTIVLDVPPEVANGRMARPLDRMEQQGAAFHARVREGFLNEATRAPERIVVVDASGAVEEVQASIRRIMERGEGRGEREKREDNARRLRSAGEPTWRCSTPPATAVASVSTLVA